MAHAFVGSNPTPCTKQKCPLGAFLFGGEDDNRKGSADEEHRKAPSLLGHFQNCYNVFGMVEDVPKRRTVKYIDPARIRKAANVQTLIGIFILVFSGVVLYSLPAQVFYLSFLVGIYFFLSGILITLSIVSERTARKMAKFLVVFWILNPKR